MYNVTIKHEQFEGGEQHWTVAQRPYFDRIADESVMAVVFFDKDPNKNEDAEVIDYIVLPKRGFGLVRAIRLSDE